MATIAAASCRHASRGRAILQGRKLLSSAAAAVEQEQAGGNPSRLAALRERLKDEENSASSVKLEDFSFSGDVSYGTAVPRRTRDKTGKVCNGAAYNRGSHVARQMGPYEALYTWNIAAATTTHVQHPTRPNKCCCRLSFATEVAVRPINQRGKRSTAFCSVYPADCLHSYV